MFFVNETGRKADELERRESDVVWLPVKQRECACIQEEKRLRRGATW